MFSLCSIFPISANVDNAAIFAWPIYAPNPSNITSLNLMILRKSYLGRILATTENLKTLKWQWAYEPNFQSEINNNVINLDQIVKDLSLVQDTLENLHLSGDASVSREHRAFPVVDIQGSLRALRGFEKLYTMEIPQLLGSLEDLMPKNIHHLTINDDLLWLKEVVWKDRDLFMLLWHWWRNFMAYTPYFHSFELSMVPDEQWSTKLGNELSDLCAQHGVRSKFKRSDEFP